MFERYTEKARRVIFFARYEASQFGQPLIETEHLLLGILREDKALTNRFLRSHASVESIRKQIEAHNTPREKIGTSVDLPLSNESKRVLAYASEEAERIGNKHIAPEHLLLGLLREENSFGAQILNERGIQIAKVREEIGRMPAEPSKRGLAAAAPQIEFVRDLTQAAIDGQFEPVFGRDLELECIAEVLCSLRRGNAVLLGEHDVGKTALLEAFAQRIADGAVPLSLADKRVLVIDPEAVAGWQMESETDEERKTSMVEAIFRFENRLSGLAQSLASSGDVILSIDSLDDLFSAALASGTKAAARILKPLLVEGKLPCIATATPQEFQAIAKANPWLEQCFRVLHVRPLDDAQTLRVLEARKERLEKHYGIAYAPEALEFAAQSASSYWPDRPLPAKALDLLDAAGAHMLQRQNALPEEILEVQKRIRFIVHRMEGAIANHEFEKARFYSDEEKKERENLRVLRERFKIDDSAAIVGRGEIEETIAVLSGYPFTP